MRASKIRFIVIHCTAGYSDVKAIEKYWFEVLKWKTGGYHRIVEENGKVNKMYDFDVVTNGVKGFNTSCINISYIGGVERKNVSKALDSRTEHQKTAIISCIIEALIWVTNNGWDVNKVKILGHRDFSPDKNGNGIIEPWERIKECPSFDAITEYKYLQKKLITKD